VCVYSLLCDCPVTYYANCNSIKTLKTMAGTVKKLMKRINLSTEIKQKWFMENFM
jgi:hypothetical protein